MKKLGKLGVIGGLGPAASSFFYSNLIRHTKASCDQEHIDTIILSHATTPDRTKAIVSGKTDEVVNSLEKDIKILEELGVSNIAIPCNTSHYFYDELQRSTKVPIINMVKESVKYIVDRDSTVKKIGIMGTDGTIGTGIFDKECEKLGVEAVHPSIDRQKDVMHIIYNEIKKGLPGSKERFEKVVEELRNQGCGYVLLACTELSVYRECNEVPDICIDTMEVLVKESIIRSGAAYQ